MDRSELLTFLRDQKWAVEASVSVHGAPQAAVVGIVVTDDLEIVFDTFDDSRKAQNLRRNRKIALTVGWDDGRTVQIEGNAEEPRGEELARLTKLYFARFTDGEERAKATKTTYFRVRPTWIRISDFRGKEPSIVTMTMGDLREGRRPGRGHSKAAEAPPVEAPPAVEPAIEEASWDEAPLAEATPSSDEATSSEAPPEEPSSSEPPSSEPSSSEPPSSAPRGSGQGSLFEK